MKPNQLPALLAIAMLASCGSGGGDRSSQGIATPEPIDGPIHGSYDGVTNTGRKVSTIFSGSGEIWTIYTSAENSSVIGGFAYGKSTSSGGKLTASVKDFNLEGAGVISGSASATYRDGQSIDGSINYPSIRETISFSGVYDATYNVVAYISNIAGTYKAIGVNEFTDEGVELSIDNDGAITGKGDSGCVFSGSVLVDPTKHLFTVAIRFGAPPCLYANQDFRGIATYDLGSKTLASMVVNTGESAGFVLVGEKQ